MGAPAAAAQPDEARQARRRRPVILAVDDEPAVLAAVSRDLRRTFGERYQVLRATSGPEALDTLKEARSRGLDVALLVADQRMPGMQGTEYLVQARQLAPGAKRVLLTAYADVEAAISAINDVALDYYLRKPWEPAEIEEVLGDLLTTWEADAVLDRPLLRVIGHRYSRESHEVRDFLHRNRVPNRWVDVERDGEARELLTVAGVAEDRLPVVLLEDGSVLERPTPMELAERLPGVSTSPSQELYDLVIVGGGPAGLAAAVYGASEGLKTILVEREATGGQAGQSSRIENYLGFPTGLSGSDLARRGTDQARRLGAEMLTVQDAQRLEVDGAKVVHLADSTQLQASAVLIASGVSWRRLECPGFEELQGRGVYYGAGQTEAIACKDQHAVVIGGANSAGQSAVNLAHIGARVTLLTRSPLEKSMSSYLVAQIADLPQITVRTGAESREAIGDDRLRRLRYVDGDGEHVEDVDALFVFIGAAPRTDWLDGVVARDARGFVLAGPDARTSGWPLKRDPYVLESSVPGVFVAGDVRASSIKRVASAVGEGSMAVSLIHQYLGSPE